MYALIKNAIGSYPLRLESYKLNKLTLYTLISIFEKIFDKVQRYFMTNVIQGHKALKEKLFNIFTELGNLKLSMDKWAEHCSSVDEKRKIFDH